MAALLPTPHAKAPNVLLIGLQGPIGCGKSLVGTLIEQYFQRRWGSTHSLQVHTLAMADALKQSAQALFHLTHDQLHDQTAKATPDPFWQVTPRRLLQIMGTEFLRNLSTFLPEFPYAAADFHVCRHALAVRQWAQSASQLHIIIVPDCRYANECDYITRSGGWLWRIHNPHVEAQLPPPADRHPSERFEDLAFHHQIDNPYSPATANPAESTRELEKCVTAALDEYGQTHELERRWSAYRRPTAPQ